MAVVVGVTQHEARRGCARSDQQVVNLGDVSLVPDVHLVGLRVSRIESMLEMAQLGPKRPAQPRGSQGVSEARATLGNEERGETILVFGNPHYDRPGAKRLARARLCSTLIQTADLQVFSCPAQM